MVIKLEIDDAALDAAQAKADKLEFTLKNIQERLDMLAGVDPKTPEEFVGVDVILGNKDYRGRVLSYALSELRAFQRKYAAYEELMGVCKAIDAFADTVK